MIANPNPSIPPINIPKLSPKIYRPENATRMVNIAVGIKNKM
jgi:hypothetical protein